MSEFQLFELEPVESIIRMGINRTVSCTGFSKEHVIEVLTEFVKSRKEGLQTLQNWFELLDEDLEKMEKVEHEHEEEEEEEEEEEDEDEDEDERKRKKWFKGIQQEIRNSQLLKFVELTNKYTKAELEKRFNFGDNSKKLFIRYLELIQSVDDMLPIEMKKTKTAGGHYLPSPPAIIPRALIEEGEIVAVAAKNKKAEDYKRKNQAAAAHDDEYVKARGMERGKHNSLELWNKFKPLSLDDNEKREAWEGEDGC